MSEQNYTLDNISTFVTLPVDTFDSDTLQRSEPLRIIKNAIIKKLPDGSLCIIDANEVNDGLSQIEVTYLPPIQNDLTAAPPLEKSPVNVDNIKNDSKEVPSHSPATPTYKCPRCKEVFNKTGSFKKHLMSHKNMKKFKCDKCSAGYNVETNLKIHMAMHSEGKPSCPICHISFQRTASLKSHLMLHQVEELYTCEECGAEFDKEEDLNKHLNSHIHNTAKENNSLICHYCNDQFEDYKSYKEHLSFHAKVKKLVLSGKKSRRTHGNKLYPHVCNICSKSFSRVSLLERHLRVHSGEKPFVCQHCNRGFNQKGTLQIHLSKHTGIKPFQCTLCSAKFNQKGNLRVHVQKTHTVPQPGAKVYRCSHCPCIFKKIASLNIHITRFHANHEEIGNNITNVINRLKELEEVATVTPDEKQDMNKNTSCDNIDINKDTSYVRLAESFLDGTVQRYLVMQKKVNDVRWYICSYCNKEFKKPSDLIRHTRVHTKEKPFECNKCGATFSLKTSLYYHSKTHLSNNNNYLCSICLKKFSSVRSVNSHIRKHLEKPQYKCLTCSKWFTSMQKAKIHNKEVHCNQSEKDLSQTVMKQPLLKTSNGLLPVPPPKSNITATKQVYCPICSAKFSKIPNLKRHMLLHNGERKYKCGQCLKSYYTPNGLKEHLSNHSAMKNFGCKVCGKKYATASLLKRHAISHSTNKPYVCPYCSKSFKSLMLCRKHINIHKKDGNIQITHNETNEVQNVNNLDKLHLSVIPDSVSNATNLLINNQSNSTSQLINNNVLVTQPNTSQVVDPSVNIIQTQIDKQLYELSPNSIQIITNSDKDITQDPNQIQTIFINCDDLPLGDNLYTSNADTLLFNSLNDLQETNSFNIESINGNFSTQTTETFNVNQIVTNESTNKITKTNNSNLNTSYYPQSDLNLLFNLDTEFVSNSCDLPNENLNLPDINVNEVPNLNVEQLQENQESKEKSKPLKCEKCNKEFSNKRTFSKHLSCHKDRKKVGGGVHHCSFCQKCFKKHSDLVRHIRTHTGEKPFACDKCEKKFTLKSTLLSHERTHNPVSHKQFSCVVCNSFFTSKSSLKVHMSIHTGDKTHKCNFCSIKFRTAAHRKSHENNYHLNPPKKQTKNKVTNLLASVAMDVLNQPEQVGLQNDQIVTGGDLENVLVVQEPIQLSDDQLNLLNEPNQNTLTESTQLEPLILQQLQSNFISSLIQLDDGTLLNVKAINTEEEATSNVSLPVQKPRNLECDICNKKYASKEVLRKHKKIHGIDKKFRCSQCLKGFDGKEDLDMHQKTHEGLRPYPCFYCANSFSKQQSLTTHLKRIHNVSFTKDNSLLCDLK